MKLATVAVSPFKVLWAPMPTSLSGTTEVGGLPGLASLLLSVSSPRDPSLRDSLVPPPNGKEMRICSVH